MILLKATNESLQIASSSIAAVDYSISFADITTTTFTPSTSEGKITTATTTTIVVAPPSSTQRQIKLITISNTDVTLSVVVYIQKLISATTYKLTPTLTLLAGETIQYLDGSGWTYYSATGAIKASQTAAGSNAQVQYNNNGIAAGSSGFTFDATNVILSIPSTNAVLNIGSSGVTTPTTPVIGTLDIFARSVANRMMISQIGPSGLDSALQPLLARNKVGYWNPPGNSTTVPGVFGITALTANGTATTRTVATTSLATRMRRIGYPSSTTAGTFAGARLPVTQFSPGSGSPDGSGFMLIERWVESDPTPVSGRRSFHGMTATTAAFTNLEPSSLLNVVGICQLSNDATQWYWQGAGSSAQAAVAIGTAVGAPGGNSTTAWELAIFAPNGVANTFSLQLTNVTTSAVATITLTGAAAVIPQSTTLLTWNGWATNNATAASVGIDICSLYIETDT
jgi:hypothetical protein